MTQYIRFPNSVTGNASVSQVGTPPPTYATLAGFIDGTTGFLTGLTLTSGGGLPVSDLANGPVAPGAPAAKSELIGAIFNAVLPTLASGQQAALQADSSGRLLIGALATGANTIGAVTQASGPWTQNLTQVGGVALALGQTTMAASIPMAIASDQSTLPANITQVGGVALSLGQKVMASSVPVTIASDQTAILFSDAANGPVTPGAVASKSELMGVQFNTVLPTLTNGQQAAAQADSSGRLLIGALATGANVIGAVTQSGGPWTQNLTQVGGAALALGQAAMAASLPVAIASNQSNLPANITQVGGAALALGQALMAASVPVAIASDQGALPTKSPVNTTGSGSAAAATVSTVITLTAPANAAGFILMNLDTSTANVRWSIGRVATATLGQQLQPARDTGFVPGGANVSLCAESGTQNYDIQWISQ